MRVKIAVIFQDEIVEDSLCISTDGTDPELAIGQDVKRMMQHAAMTLGKRKRCPECHADVGSTCEPGCLISYEDRYRYSEFGNYAD